MYLNLKNMFCRVGKDVPHTVYELKPNNPNQIKKGTKQLENYLKEIEEKFGKGWKGILDTY